MRLRSLTAVSQKIVLALLLSLGYYAEADDLCTATKLRKVELESHRAKIFSESAEEAIAAVEVGLASGDPELRSMTLEAAFQSDDIRVQTAALRWLFSERSKLLFQVDQPPQADNGSSFAYELWEGHVLRNFKFDKNTDEIIINESNYKGGQLIRGGFQLEYAWYPDRREGYRCTFLGRIDKEAVSKGKIQLTGSIDCLFPPLDNHPAKGDEDGSVAFVVSLS